MGSVAAFGDHVSNRGMFYAAPKFNQPLSSWQTSSIVNMKELFRGATLFDQNINSWRTAAVTNMESCFDGASKFNRPLNAWETSKVTDMGSLFSHAAAFDGNLSAWQTEAVTDMKRMFQNTYSLSHCNKASIARGTTWAASAAFEAAGYAAAWGNLQCTPPAVYDFVAGGHRWKIFVPDRLGTPADAVARCESLKLGGYVYQLPRQGAFPDGSRGYLTVADSYEQDGSGNRVLKAPGSVAATAEQAGSIAFIRRWGEYLDNDRELYCGFMGGEAELGQCYTQNNLYVFTSQHSSLCNVVVVVVCVCVGGHCSSGQACNVKTNDKLPWPLHYR